MSCACIEVKVPMFMHVLQQAKFVLSGTAYEPRLHVDDEWRRTRLKVDPGNENVLYKSTPRTYRL